MSLPRYIGYSPMLCTCVATCSSALRIPLLVCFTPVATLFYSIYLLTHLGIISGVNTQMLALYNAADTAEAVSLTCLDVQSFARQLHM